MRLKTVKEMTTGFQEFPKMAAVDRSIISLTNGGYAICSEEDFAILSAMKWFHVFDGNAIYAATSSSGGRMLKMHSAVIGGPGADHINGDGLDNRRCNLRYATNSQNQMNRSKFAEAHSRHKGVTWNIRDLRWTARIQANGGRINLGSFRNEVDAALAYNTAAVNYFGTFARANVL